MKQSRILVIFLLLAALSLSGIFDHELWTPDEPRDAEIGREMLESGSWAIPTLNRQPHLEKPPLYFWSVASAYAVFGVHAWSARLPSVLFAWGSLLFTFLIARQMFGRRAALQACLILATMALFLDVTHKSTVDNALLFFFTGTLFWLYTAMESDLKLWSYLLAYVFALGTFMSKGLVGVGLAGTAFLVFLFWMRKPREILHAHPWFAVLILGVGAMEWLATLTPELRRVFLVDNQIWRFTGKNYSGGHIRPFYYYGPAMFYAFAPWILAFIPAIPWTFRRDGDVVPKRFLLAWIVAGFILLSLASTKREIYLLPLCPAVAILVSAWFERVLARPRWAEVCLVIFASIIFLGDLAVWGAAIYIRNWSGLAIAVGLVAATAYWVRGQSRPQALAVGTASFALAVIFVLFPYLDGIKNLAPFCRGLPLVNPIPAYLPDETTRAIVPFYTGRYVRAIKDYEEAQQQASLRRPAYIVAVRKREFDTVIEDLKAWYPYVWAGHESRGDRTMVLLANVPK